LGGEDFDQRMMDHFAKEFKRQHGQGRKIWSILYHTIYNPKIQHS
jgi:molecular chaperone DnaK (HSP70)